MAAPAQSYFRTLTRHVKEAVESITLERLDVNPDRALWEVHGIYRHYHIRLKEIHTSNAPEQNPMEDVWFAAKTWLRKHWYLFETFQHVTHQFVRFIHDFILESRKFEWYWNPQLI